MRNRSTLFLYANLAALLLAAPPAWGVSDLDLLARASVPPNIMLILDNSGSMRSQIDGVARIQIAGDTLEDLIDKVNPDLGDGTRQENARFGLARFPVGESAFGGLVGSPYWNGCVGATIAQPIASGNEGSVLSSIQNIVTQVLPTGTEINADGTCLSETLVDVGRYLSGGEGFSAYPSDLSQPRTLPLYIEPNPRTRVTKTMEPICSGDCPSPMDLSCRQNFAIFITDGKAVVDENDHYGSPDSGSSSAYDAFLSTIGNADGDQNECVVNTADPADCHDDPALGRDDGVTYTNMGTDWLDDVAYFLNNTDFKSSLDGQQNIVTYTIGFAIDHVLLSDAGTAGGGGYYTATQGTELAQALDAAIADITERTQASFTSAVVPGGQTGHGTAFYNSYFEVVNEPVWPGHLEAYRLAPNGQIQDSGLNPATDPATGELVPGRTPYWDAADPLKTNASRTIYTTKAASRVAFNNSNVSESDLDLNAGEIPSYPNHPSSGVDTLPELRDAVIRYIRGKDGFDEDDDGDNTEMRETVLGDIFHSTPRVVGPPRGLTLREPSYVAFQSAYATRDRVIYAGANDGLLHAFNAGTWFGGDNPATPETENGYYSPGDGSERFGYVPGLILDRVKLVPRNKPRTEYFVDGPLVVADAWLGDSSGAFTPKVQEDWATVLLAGLRDGGRGYLALDVTDPDAGSGDPHGPYPLLLWEFSHAKLGHTWSKPIVTRVKLRNDPGTDDHCGKDDVDGDCREEWVAIFGGGYEADGDPNRSSYVADPTDASWSDRSKAIFMVSLRTGQVLASVQFDATGLNGPDDMLYSIPSDPTVLDLDFDGFSDVVYVGDLGGQVWKWDIHAVGEDTDSNGTIDNWPAGVFFRTEPTDVGGGVLHYRSFFFPPAAAVWKNRLYLSFASGERNDLGYEGVPAVNENNRLFVMRDLFPMGSNAFAATLSEADLTDVTNLDTDTNGGDAGYFFQVEDAEKFVSEITIFAGKVITTSYTPNQGADVCSTLTGQSYLYVLDLKSGQGFFESPSDPPSEDRRMHIGGGLPSAPRVTVTGNPEDDVIIIKTSDGRIVQVDAPPRDDPKASWIYWKREN